MNNLRGQLVTKGYLPFILYLIGLAASYFLIARVYYVFGMMDERFDRYHANKKLQECLEVIKQ